MKKPKYSIIIPYWNAERWITRCASSLKQQTGPFEFIFVNDQSTDEGEARLREIADERFVLLGTYGDHKGVSAARNTGLLWARGDWIAFLDADDELLPGADKIYDGLAETGSPISQLNHIRCYVNRDGATTNPYDNAPGEYPLDNLPLAWFGVWNKLYKAELIKDIRFDETMQYAEDELFNLECLKRARGIHHGHGYLVKHNIENKDSLSHIRSAEDLIRQIQKLGDFIIANDDPALRKVAYNMMNFHVNSSWYWKAICGE